MELARLPALAQASWFRLRYGRRSNKRQELDRGPYDVNPARRRAQRRLQRTTSEFLAGSVYPNFVFVLFVSLTYAVVAPVVPLVACFYFAIALVVFKHQHLFVYVPRYETGGTLWPTLSDYTLTSLQFALLSLIGYLSLKGGSTQALVLLPLLVVIEAFRCFTHKTFLVQAAVLSRARAVAVDARHAPPSAISRDEELEPHPANLFDPFLYQQPELSAGAASPKLRPDNRSPSGYREVSRGAQDDYEGYDSDDGDDGSPRPTGIEMPRQQGGMQSSDMSSLLRGDPPSTYLSISMTPTGVEL